MSWIKASQDIDGHWKLQDLCSKTGWDSDQAIGKLLRFWWWVQKYAEDGDLSRFSAPQIDFALKLPEGTKFLEILAETQFVDRVPYLRVHDWWDHNGPWLQSRYKQYPEKWERIKRRYKSATRANRSTNVQRTFSEPTKDVDNVDKNTEQALTAFYARETLTAPDATKALTSPTPKPITNRSTNRSSTKQTKKRSEKVYASPTEAVAEVLDHVQKNMPFAGKVIDCDSDWEGRSLATETARYGSSAMKALWDLYTDPSAPSYAFAKGQSFSIREFVRQVPALTDNPEYGAIHRRYREATLVREPQPVAGV